MSHYDIISIIAGCFLIIISFGVLAYLLAARSWNQAEMLLHEEQEEIKPLFPQIEWNATTLMDNCPDCQREQEQAL